MSHHLEIEKAKGYLHIKFSGPFSPAAAMESVDAMVAACANEDRAKILFDCRPMTGDMKMVDQFDIAQYGALKIPRSVKIAMLGREDQISPDRFFQTVARNHGVRVTAFSEIDDAIKWLKER
jgi:hypothetical protein